MALVKQKFREIILQLLYSFNYVFCEENFVVPFMMNQIKTTKKNIITSLEYVKKIVEHFDQFDFKIKQISTSYDLSRITKIELNILRLAMYEIEYDNLPFKIVISEAIRLTKKFSSSNSISFINAILGRIYQKKYGNNKK